MARKVRYTPQESSEKWNRRLKQSIPDIQKGIERVTEAPGKKAAAKAEKMRSGINAALDSGRWQRGVAGVPLEEWQAKTKQKVGERLSGGVDAAMGKRTKFDEYMVATVNASLAKLEGMADLTFEDSMARVRAHAEHMRDNPYKK